jgi:hypothetical protein
MSITSATTKGNNHLFFINTASLFIALLKSLRPGKSTKSDGHNHSICGHYPVHADGQKQKVFLVISRIYCKPSR